MSALAPTRSLAIRLNLDVRGMGPSPALAIAERCTRLQQEGRTVHNLGLARSPFPIPEPMVEALRVNAFQKNYLPTEGLHELRQAIAAYHHRQTGVDYDSECVLIGPGSKQLMFLLQLGYYGDVVVPTPAWVSYAPQAEILGRHISWVHTHRTNGWKLLPDDLDSVCREDPSKPRVVVLNYPSSPTGGTYGKDELEALARVARKYNLIVLSDEIYGQIHHLGRHVSIATFYPEGTIISGGLSKWCGADGWRLGTFTFPRELAWLREAIRNIASETFTSTSAPIQYAAVAAFRGGPEIEQYLLQSRRILSALGGWVTKRLRQATIAVEGPAGGFCLFLDFDSFRGELRKRGIWTSRHLCGQLLRETGVAILPGSEFGRREGELTARLAYVDFDGTSALKAAAQIPIDRALGNQFVQSTCNNVATAIELLCHWLKN